MFLFLNFSHPIDELFLLIFLALLVVDVLKSKQLVFYRFICTPCTQEVGVSMDGCFACILMFHSTQIKYHIHLPIDINYTFLSSFLFVFLVDSSSNDLF